ncbi:MAG: hypothetical protein IKN81_09665 [Oscillospiraceae bacterium]|nr:hypothetical protein [Oscillospiraceae bacterium]
MTDSARSRKLRYVTVDMVPLRSLVLALFLASGILAGYAVALRCTPGTADELRRFLDGFPAGAISPESALRTLLCYFRSSVLAFLMGFASIGVVGLPLLMAAQGFVLSFSMVSFAAALGREGFAALLALFALRVLFVLPGTFMTATAALDKARLLFALSIGTGKRAAPVLYGARYWYRFAVTCVCLGIGSGLELWLTPLLLARLI